MTGAETITKFENMVQDVLDSDFAYQLMNDAKDEIEAMADWEILKRETTYSVAAGYTYASSLGSLPTNFGNDLRVVESSGYPEYSKVSFEDLDGRKNSGQSYFLDLNNDVIHLTGEGHGAKTIHLFYTLFSDDITSVTSWAFPSRFHNLLTLKMAQLYYYADAGERARTWDDKWAEQLERGLNLMLAWNDRLKMKNRTPRGRGVGDLPKAVNRRR